MKKSKLKKKEINNCDLCGKRKNLDKHYVMRLCKKCHKYIHKED